MIVVVVLVLAGLAVLGAVVVLAMGRGGELTPPSPDHPPLPPLDDPAFIGGRPLPPRLPRAVWGYQVDVADQAFDGLRRALWERDARVAALEEQVTDLHRVINERAAGRPGLDPGPSPVGLEKDGPEKDAGKDDRGRGTPGDRDVPDREDAPTLEASAGHEAAHDLEAAPGREGAADIEARP